MFLMECSANGDAKAWPYGPYTSWMNICERQQKPARLSSELRQRTVHRSSLLKRPALLFAVCSMSLRAPWYATSGILSLDGRCPLSLAFHRRFAARGCPLFLVSDGESGVRGGMDWLIERLR